MTVIADITVPADAFPLGRILEDVPDVEIELERVVPLQEATAPLFWIAGGEQALIESTLQSHDETESVERLTATAERTLYEVRWSPAIDGLVDALVDTRATVLEATGTADSWDFRLRFPSHEELSAFNVALTERDVPVTLRHIFDPADAPSGAGSASASSSGSTSALTPDQRETLLLAYRQGYFEVPRRTTLSELAETVAVSDSALSQRLRRATNSLVEDALLPDERQGT